MRSMLWDAKFPPYDLEQCSSEELHELKVILETMQERLHQMERIRRLAELQAADRSLTIPWLTRITLPNSALLVLFAGATLFGTLLGLLSLFGILLLSSRFF